MTWTTPTDLKAQVQKLWDRGCLLAPLAGGDIILPKRLVLKGPSSRELSERFPDVRDWIAQLSATAGPYRIEWRTVNHRVLGSNQIPSAIWVDSLNDALDLLGKRRAADTFSALVGETREQQPELIPWLARYPLRAVALAGDWERLLAVVAWVREHPHPAIYLRQIDLPGIDHSKVVSYTDVLNNRVKIGRSVALIGAGGIGFDVAEFLSHPDDHGPDPSSDPFEAFASEWGIDQSLKARGGVAGVKAQPPESPREIWLLQRRAGKPGKTLGKTTGWIHRLSLRNRGVHMLGNVTYESIDDQGLHISIDGKKQLLKVDHVVVCAGQVSNLDLSKALEGRGLSLHVIGGAQKAAELDAKYAIREGSELAARL